MIANRATAAPGPAGGRRRGIAVRALLAAAAVVLAVPAGRAQEAFDAADLPQADRAAIQQFLETERTDTRRQLPESGAGFVIVRTETRPRICRWFVVEVPGDGPANGVGCRVGSRIWDIAGTTDALPAQQQAPAPAEAPAVAEGPPPGSAGAAPAPAAPAATAAATPSPAGRPAWAQSPPRPPARPGARSETAAVSAGTMPPALAGWPQPPRRPGPVPAGQVAETPPAGPSAEPAAPDRQDTGAPAPAAAPEVGRPVPAQFADWPPPPPRDPLPRASDPPAGGETSIVFTEPPPPLPGAPDEPGAAEAGDVVLAARDPRETAAENLLTGERLPAVDARVGRRDAQAARPVPTSLADVPAPPRRPAEAEAGIVAPEAAPAPIDPPLPPRPPRPPARG